MKRRILVLAAAASLAMACEDANKQKIQRIDADAETLGRASALVNEVIRNSPDCEVARPLLVEAYQRIDEARGRVRLAASQQTLAAMKTQVDRVAQACP